MPIITKRWSFVTDAEGWQLELNGATGITSGWTSADNATGDTASSGCIWIDRTGQNLSNGQPRWYLTISALQLGMPPDAIGAQMRVTYMERCSAYTYGSSTSYAKDPYVVVNGRGTVYDAGGSRTYSGTTSWAQRADVWAAVYLLPTEQMTIYCEVKPNTGNSSSGYVSIRLDAIEIAIDYVLPSDEPSGALSIIVNNNEIAPFVRADSLQITRGANGRAGQCNFICLAAGWSDPIGSILQAGTDLLVSIGGTIVFRGETTGINISSQSGHVRYAVEARDIIGKLARCIIPYTEVTSTTVGALISTLVQSYCTDVLNPSTAYIADSRTLSSYTVLADTAVDAFRQIAAQYPAAWYVDTDLQLHWRPITALEHSGRRYSVSPGFYDDSQLVDSISYETDISALANRVVVVSSYDSYSSESISPNPSASANDGYLSGSSTTWPVSSASTVSTSDSTLIIRGRNVVSKIQTTISYASRVYKVKQGSTWPPTRTPSVSTSGPESSYRDSGVYVLRCDGFKFNIPSNLTGISQIQLIITLGLYDDYPNDSYDKIWIERSNEYYYDDPSTYPQLTFIGNLNIESNTYTVTAPIESAGSTVYYRFGVWPGFQTSTPPGGVNYARITDVQMRITHDDPTTSYEESRALVRFDTSAIPDTATVTSAVLRLNCASKNDNWNPNIEVRSASPTMWPLDTSDWSGTNGTVLATVSASSISANQLLDISIPIAAISLTGYTAFALRISPSAAPGSGQECNIQFWSYDHNTLVPQLIVQYTHMIPGVNYTAQDPASQAVYGLRELSIYRPQVTLKECTDLAVTQLATRAWPIKQIDFASFYGAGVWPGQKVYLDLSPVLSPDHYMITSLRMDILTNERIKYALSVYGTQITLEDLLMTALG